MKASHLVDQEAASHAGRPGVSAVIVNYNGHPFLKDCLDTLVEALGTCSFEIIVVDNASSDGSREYLRQRPDIRLIESEVNAGFTGGNNIGVAAARGEYVLLLNNDTVCLTSLAPLLECMDDRRVGVAGCALCYADNRLQPSVGYEHTPSRIVLSWLGLGALGNIRQYCSRLRIDSAYYRQTQGKVDWVSGACLLTRVDLWRQLGGLDDEFFMYCEDVDYCRRVRLEGYQVMYTPDSQVRHFEAAGKAWIGEKALKRTARSYLLYMKKHFGIGAQFFVASLLGAIFILRSLVYRAGSLVSSKQMLLREKRRAYVTTGFYLVSHGLADQALKQKL